MKRDKLIILKANFGDPAFPDKRFYCWHCVLMEGILASFPALSEVIDVERISWPRPRQEVVDLIGETNQSLPVLILADEAPIELATGVWNGRYFVEGKDSILNALALRHGIPLPHP